MKKPRPRNLSDILFDRFRHITHPDLEECIKKTLVHEAGDGSLIAHLTDFRDPPTASSRIWRLRQGNLKPESEEALHKALGDVRSKWPPRTILFVIRELKKNGASVSVVEHYSSGIKARTRGGQRQEWEFAKVSGAWKPVKKDILMVWD